jgi:hypothetical protein
MSYKKPNRVRYTLYRISIIIWNIRYYRSIFSPQKPSSYFIWRMSICLDRLNVAWIKMQNLIDEINEQESKDIHVF